MAGGQPNLVPNPGFERDANGDGVPDGWRRASGPAAPTVVGAPTHSGARSIRISSAATSTSASLSTTVALRPDTEYILWAWFRSHDVLPSVATAVREPTARHSSVRIVADQLDASGRIVGSAYATGYTDTAPWNRGAVGFRTGAAARAVRISILLLDGSGTAWFDDVSLSRLFAPEELRPTLRVTGSALDRRAAGEVPGTGLRLDARLRTFTDHVAVGGTVIGTGGADRAFRLTFTLPVAAGGWTWYDDARHARPAASGTYALLTTSQEQQVSRYPFGVVGDARSAVAIGIPLDEPRVFRIEDDPSTGLSISFDLGVSPAATKLGPRASFSFVLYSPAPAWGFRAATQAYYDLFPSFFLHRTEARCEGSWFVAPPLNDVERSSGSFGLGLDMVALGRSSHQNRVFWGTRYLPFDQRHGVYSTAYGHHWAFFDPIASARTPLPTYDAALALVRRQAASRAGTDTQRELRTEASAALRWTQRDVNGRLLYERYGRFLAYYEDPQPSSSGDWADAVQREQVDVAMATARRDDDVLNGLHLDSTSGMRRWGAADDYDRAHWALASEPLTFSDDTGQVVERGLFEMYPNIAATAAFAHRHGMFVSANFNADATRAGGDVGADLIDYFGLEQGLEARAAHGQTIDQFAMLKRTLADDRPVSTLDASIGRNRLSAARIDETLQCNLFYGIFAGAWNPAAEADGQARETTWTSSADAGLWARYTPLFRNLDAAGWRPITDATSSNAAVWVERFGSLSARNLFLTLRNDTDSPQLATITIHEDALGGSIGAVAEVLTGSRLRTTLATAAGGRTVAVAVRIPPRSTRVLRVSAAPRS
jgi:hypothetical protein